MEAQDTPSRATFTERFSAYFAREVAHTAAKSISNGAEIEFCILQTTTQTSTTASIETFTFTRVGGQNKILATLPSSPQLTFKISDLAAEEILNDPTEEVGRIGVNIAKLIFSPDANRRVSIQIHAGFMTLFAKGYFGVLTAGGSEFGSFLAARGLNGLKAIQSLLRKKNDL